MKAILYVYNKSSQICIYYFKRCSIIILVYLIKTNILSFFIWYFNLKILNHIHITSFKVLHKTFDTQVHNERHMMCKETRSCYEHSQFTMNYGDIIIFLRELYCLFLLLPYNCWTVKSSRIIISSII